MSNVFESKRTNPVFGLDLTALTVKIECHHLLELILKGVSKVSDHAIENMRKLLDEAKEAHRLLATRERRTNDYQILNLRSSSSR